MSLLSDCMCQLLMGQNNKIHLEWTWWLDPKRVQITSWSRTNVYGKKRSSGHVVESNLTIILKLTNFNNWNFRLPCRITWYEFSCENELEALSRRSIEIPWCIKIQECNIHRFSCHPISLVKLYFLEIQEEGCVCGGVCLCVVERKDELYDWISQMERSESANM